MQPSPGEAYDRMTILALKIKHSDRKEFVIEHEDLCKYMKEHFYNVPTDLATELGRINSRLWDLEDSQREIIKEHPTMSTDIALTFAQNAYTIVVLNDARAETVKKINASCGIDSVEKLHDSV